MVRASPMRPTDAISCFWPTHAKEVHAQNAQRVADGEADLLYECRGHRERRNAGLMDAGRINRTLSTEGSVVHRCLDQLKTGSDAP
jgi:hypothetical protein